MVQVNVDMTKEEKYAYWLQLAQYDLDTAKTMYAGGRWFYVAFMCQQALEKLCKGLYNFYIDDNVPKIHNIPFILAKIEALLSLTVKPEVYDLIDTLSSIISLTGIRTLLYRRTFKLIKPKQLICWRKPRRPLHGC
jgi:HEPN domain-containing protein